MIGVERVAQECGIKAAADSLGIPLGEFESGTQVASRRAERQTASYSAMK
ncbi:MAG: hypothetical protein V8R14_05625 [Clostridia bacterium]